MQLFASVSRLFHAISVVRRARAGPRVFVDQQVPLHIPARKETHPVLLRDLSVGGACVRTDLRLVPGEDVWLCVDAGLETQFELNATIISVRNHAHGFYTDFGLRLIGLNMRDARTLNAFITSRLEAHQTQAMM